MAQYSLWPRASLTHLPDSSTSRAYVHRLSTPLGTSAATALTASHSRGPMFAAVKSKASRRASPSVALMPASTLCSMYVILPSRAAAAEATVSSSEGGSYTICSVAMSGTADTLARAAHAPAFVVPSLDPPA